MSLSAAKRKSRIVYAFTKAQDWITDYIPCLRECNVNLLILISLPFVLSIALVTYYLDIQLVSSALTLICWPAVVMWDCVIFVLKVAMALLIIIYVIQAFNLGTASPITTWNTLMGNQTINTKIQDFITNYFPFLRECNVNQLMLLSFPFVLSITRVTYYLDIQLVSSALTLICWSAVFTWNFGIFFLKVSMVILIIICVIRAFIVETANPITNWNKWMGNQSISNKVQDFITNYSPFLRECNVNQLMLLSFPFVLSITLVTYYLDIHLLSIPLAIVCWSVVVTWDCGVFFLKVVMAITVIIYVILAVIFGTANPKAIWNELMGLWANFWTGFNTFLSLMLSCVLLTTIISTFAIGRAVLQPVANKHRK